jgi:hypothetical protein
MMKARPSCGTAKKPGAPIWTAIKLSSFGHPPYRSNLGFGHEEDQAAASPVPRSKLLLDPRQREDIFTR